jgi:hypothetical protein
MFLKRDDKSKLYFHVFNFSTNRCIVSQRFDCMEVWRRAKHQSPTTTEFKEEASIVVIEL